MIAFNDHFPVVIQQENDHCNAIHFDATFVWCAVCLPVLLVVLGYWIRLCVKITKHISEFLVVIK